MTLTLIAGARRLEVTKRLGTTMIEVRRVGELTEQERRIIELEDNLHRKTLTPLERSQTPVRLADALGARLREQAQTQVAQRTTPHHDPDLYTQTPSRPAPDELNSGGVEKPPHRGGRQPMPDRQEHVAAEMGVSVGTLNEARQHLTAVNRYPELGDANVSRAEALRCWKAWNALTPSKRTRARKTWKGYVRDTRSWCADHEHVS